MCKCGCDSCGVNTTPLMLNESLAPKQILSEGLKHHMDNNKPLTEHLYRAGSTNYFNLWAEARSLYSREILEITNEDDLAVLTETHLGHFGMLEDGTKVPLDFPMEITEAYYTAIANLGDKKTKENLDSFEEVQDFMDKMIKRNAISVELIKYNPEGKSQSIKYNWDGEKWLKTSKGEVNEAKNDNKKLNKPMRDSKGGKAYKVYVKDPKTGNIKTVRFGSGGLKAKINNKKARNAYAKRHKCSTRNDKTKASYWSCRLPRYAKLLGLKSSFTGFW